MNTRILFPRLLIVVASLIFSGSAIAQSSESDPRPTTTQLNRLETEPVAAPVEESRPRAINSAAPTKAATKSVPVVPTINLTNRFDQSLLTAIQSHVGAPYHFNRTGPDEFDCSGLVWRAFQDIGVNFQRGPARSYWATMPSPPEGEQFKFGTLVFFNNLGHVGIVVDEKGFYHSARHGGVMYSPFNDYWLSRINGFRRVPLETLQAPTAAAKPRTTKPVNTAALVDDDNQP